jgi:hypothetical protein
MSAVDSHSASTSRRLQVVLALIFFWDLLALIASFSFGTSLMKVSNDQIGGLLAARAEFNGAIVVPLGLYLYAIVRGPLRHRGVLWLAALEQAAAALLAVYHVAGNDIKVEGMILPLVVALFLLVVLLVWMPRGQAAV